MRNQVLSVEQMLNLLRLDIDMSSAGMCWCYPVECKNAKWELEIYEDVINQKRDSAFWEIIPAFTLQDILDKLPHYLNPFPSVLYAWMVERNAIAYRNIEDVNDCLKHFTNDLLIDCAYDMLCWCIENGYIETK